MVTNEQGTGEGVRRVLPVAVAIHIWRSSNRLPILPYALECLPAQAHTTYPPYPTPPTPPHLTHLVHSGHGCAGDPVADVGQEHRRIPLIVFLPDPAAHMDVWAHGRMDA